MRSVAFAFCLTVLMVVFLGGCSNSASTSDGDADSPGEHEDGDSADGDESACEIGATRCSPINEKIVQKCAPDQGWITFAECGAQQVCQNSECVVPSTYCERFCDAVVDCGIEGQDYVIGGTVDGCYDMCDFADLGRLIETYFPCSPDQVCEDFRTCMSGQRERCQDYADKLEACDVEDKLLPSIVPGARALCEDWFALGVNAFIFRCIEDFAECDDFYLCSKIDEDEFIDGDVDEDGDSADGDASDGDVVDGDADGDLDDEWDIEWEEEPSIDNCWHHAEMVPVEGRFCIDKWESTLRDEPNCRGQAYLTDEYESPVDFPACVECEQYNFTYGCGECTEDKIVSQTKPYYACSRPGVKPTMFASWFQAMQSCINSGKTLCLEDDWTTACQGPEDLAYPYGEEYMEGVCWDWSTMRDQTTEIGATITGSMNSCISGYGIYDMSGNVLDWTYSVADPAYQMRKGGSYLDGRYETTALACSNDAGYWKCVPGDYECIGGIRCCLYPPEESAGR